MLDIRTLVPELLDLLPSNDASAVQSRRDLQRINSFMFQPQIMARLLLKTCGARPPRRIVELGGGDGTFALKVARRLAPRWPGVTLVLVDCKDIVAKATREAFESIGWTLETSIGDVFDVLKNPDFGFADVVCINLFLHHFEGVELRNLLALIAGKTNCMVACEPRRSLFALTGSRMVFALGCNNVSRHDAFVSVKAGFKGCELSGLWPNFETNGKRWDTRETGAGLFTHTFIAKVADDRPQI